MFSSAGSISFIFEAVLVTALVVAGFAWLSIRFSKRIGLVDVPQSEPHKQHTTPTPLAGGLALVVAVWVGVLYFRVFQSVEVFAALAAGMVVFFFGLWDDFRGISPPLKFLGQILASIVLIRLGIAVRVLESPEFFVQIPAPFDLYLDWIFTILWVVAITNAFNFVDSMDGLAVGLGGLATAFFILVTLDAGQPELSRFSAVLFGVCIGLYYFNSAPAQLFLGDSGAQTLGFILAALAIAYRPQGVDQSSSWFVPVMLLAVPIFDMCLVVFSRLRRGRAIYIGALDHTYHRLLAAGMSPTRAVLAMQTAGLLLGCLAFVAFTRPPLLANALFALTLLAGLLAYFLLDRRARWR